MSGIKDLFAKQKIGRAKKVNVDRKNEFEVGLSKKESFCLILRHIVEDRETLLQLLESITKINDDKLAGQFNTALKDIDGYWQLIESYKDIDDVAAERMLSFSKDEREGNMLASIARLLWEAGSGILDLGTGKPDIKKLNVSVDIRSALERYEDVLENAFASKTNSLKNARERILECLPVRETRSLVNDQDKRKYIDDLLDSFERGSLNSKFNIQKFKYPKESGVFIPCTLEPKEWIAQMVTAVVKYEFGENVKVMFRSSDIADIRRASESDYILFSDDEDSPYAITSTPALYCCEVDETGDVPTWQWRNDQETINKKVNFEVTKSGDSSTTARELLLKQITKEYALTYVNGDDAIEWALPYLGSLSDSLSQKCEAEMVLKFFKRGLSKLNQVDENPGFIHMVSSVVARTMSMDKFYPFMLSDWNVVVLFPLELWEHSECSRLGKSKNYATVYGMKNLSTMSDPLLVYSAFYGLSHIREMFRALSQGENYDYEAHALRLLSVAFEDGSYPHLFSSTKKDPSKRAQMLEMFTSVYPGPLIGLQIAPQSTRVGKASRENLMHDVGFNKHFEGMDSAAEVKRSAQRLKSDGDKLKNFVLNKNKGVEGQKAPQPKKKKNKGRNKKKKFGRGKGKKQVDDSPPVESNYDEYDEDCLDESASSEPAPERRKYVKKGLVSSAPTPKDEARGLDEDPCVLNNEGPNDEQFSWGWEDDVVSSSEVAMMGDIEF